MKTILVVDDEIPILRALTRLFFETNYEILTAENGEEALKLLHTYKIDLVLSDMRMPLMDGYELLTRVKEEFPSVIRVILSGYSEEKTIFKALMHNIAQLYIFKPWSNADLLHRVEQLLDTEDLLSSADLLLLFNDLAELPTISASYQMILDLIEKDEDIMEIAEAIERDPAVSTRLLHIANSAFYGLSTSSVKQAAVYVGMQNVRSLIFSTSILNVSQLPDGPPSWSARLWEHSLLTNKLLHFIYDELLLKKIPEAAWSAGLLHNIGVVVLLRNFYEKYTQIVENAVNFNSDILECEIAEFKVTHQEIGSYLAGWWGLPFPIMEVALYHHRPFAPGIINTELVACVNIAQHYAWNLMGESIAIEFSPAVFDLAGFTAEELERRIENMLR